MHSKVYATKKNTLPTVRQEKSLIGNKMSKKNDKAAAVAAAAAAAAVTADTAYDSMSDPEIEIEDKEDTELTRTAPKPAVNVSQQHHTALCCP